MLSRKFNKCALRSSTLAELLVVMAITSVVLLIFTDGLNLFGQYTRITTNKVVRNAALWDGYCRLESLVTLSDSLLMTSAGKVEVFHKGEVGLLFVSDNMLLFSKNSIKDTLFNAVIGIEISPVENGTDSLSTTIAIGEKELRIAFAPCPKSSISNNKLRYLEEKYGYE